MTPVSGSHPRLAAEFYVGVDDRATRPLLVTDTVTKEVGYHRAYF